MPNTETTILCDSGSVTTNPDVSGLALRLGLCLNAIRAGRSFLRCASDVFAQPPHARTLFTEPRFRDWFQAFALQAAYLHEATKIIKGGGNGDPKPEGSRVEALARKGGVPLAVEVEALSVFDETHKMSPILRRARNKLIFHWDPKLTKQWAAEYEGLSRVTWLSAVHGDSPHTGEVNVLALSFLVEAIVPPATGYGVTRAELLKTFLDDVLGLGAGLNAAGDAIGTYFTCAIRGHLLDFAPGIDQHEIPSLGPQFTASPTGRLPD